MNQCPTISSAHSDSEEEQRAWGHDFNASGMFANNQGNAVDAVGTASTAPLASLTQYWVELNVVPEFAPNTGSRLC